MRPQSMGLRMSLPILSWLLLTVAGSAAAAGPCEATSPSHVVPLVELYTAEGCSDCPPADKWLSQLAASSDPTQATPLALHVDYWNEHGWVDPYSDPAFTKRQDFRVHLAKKKVRYTPHVMVGADTSVNWRDEGEVGRVLSKTRKAEAGVDLGLKVARLADGLQVEVKALPKPSSVPEKSPNMLWLALYQDGLTSKISDGENKGRTLHHDRVARTLQGPWELRAQPVDGKVKVPLPAGASLEDYGFVLFAESSETGDGLQSLGLPLGTCSL